MSIWPENVSRSPIYTGVIFLFLSFFMSGSNTPKALYVGYTFLALGLLFVIASTQPSLNMYKLFIDCLPLWVMLFIIGFILFLITKYYSIISESRVSPSYYTFSNILVILFMAQVTILNKSNFEVNNGFDIGMLGIISIGVIQFIICLLILFVILKYYSTDGFSVY
jgi:hypothetical protein